jgi:hypothetical protein
MIHFNFKQFNYETIPQRDNVVILCAGPSIMECKDKIIDYIKINNSIVMSANYNYEKYGIKSDYTYITDQIKLYENASKINSHLIIPAKMKTGRENRKQVEIILKKFDDKVFHMIDKLFNLKYDVYMVGEKHEKEVYKIKKGLINISQKGNILHRRLGSAGQGSILLSVIFKPKKILVVGFDGPILDGTYVSKELFDGKKVKYGDKNKYNDSVKYIASILIPSVLNQGIVIETFENVRLYGLNKRKLGVQVI